MKRVSAALLLICLLLSGCTMFGGRIKEPVTFYYPRMEYAYAGENAVIASEEREAAGRIGDLPYLLALYLVGPLDEALTSPIPSDTQILAVHQDGQTITIHLSDSTQALTDLEYTLVCACLTLTCLDLSNVQTVTIISGDRTLTMGADDLMLYDNQSATATTEESQ